MNERDDITILALAYLKNEAEMKQNLDTRFAEIPRAPLAQLIDAYLAVHPHLTTASILRSVAQLNQGRLEDLDVPVFVSYLVDKCNTDEFSIRSAINALRTYDLIVSTEVDRNAGRLSIAARSLVGVDDGISLDDLREQLRKRTD